MFLIPIWILGSGGRTRDPVDPESCADVVCAMADPKAYDSDAPYLTLYEMPDVGYRETEAFKGLDGQSVPRKELLEGVFKKARFDTRFYECVQEFGALVAAGMYPFAGLPTF